jgi:MerR family transcriptional regulator, light-induced transcriptional regulator
LQTAVEIEQEAGRLIKSAHAALAEAITERHYQFNPDLARRYGDAGRAKCSQDAQYHLSYLADAAAASLPSLFADYVAWAKVMLEARGVPASDLIHNLQVMRQVLGERLPAEAGRVTERYIAAGLARLPQVPSELPAFVGDEAPCAALARQYLDALLRGERQAASRLILRAVEEGESVKNIYLHVFQPCQREVGRLWQTNRLSVAEEHYCTAATQFVMSQLYPYIFAGEKNGRVLVATCVAGDLHEIGVRMVADFFEMEGWDTFYLGANTPTRDLVRTLIDRRADVLAVSATMTYHVRAVADLIAAVRGSEATREVKVLVGGYPFNVAPELWRQVGADASAADAQGAIEAAARLAADGG